MHTLSGIFSDIISTLFGVYATIVLLRFIFQLVKADFYNPISQGIVKMTSPVLVPLRRIIPGFWGLDTASLVLVLVINVLTVCLTALLQGMNPLDSLGVIAIYALLKMLTAFLNIFSFCMLVSIVLSWVAPMSSHPAATLVYQIAEPMMAPFRKIIPPMGGIDISPIFVFLAINIITRLLAAAAGMMGINAHVMAQLFVFI